MSPVPIASEDEIIQLITLGLVLFGIALEIYQWIKEPSEKYWIVSTLFWMIHAGFFYIFISLDRYTTIDMTPLFGSYTLWSSVLRLHIVVTIVILEWYRTQQGYLRKLKRDLNEKLVVAKEVEVTKQVTEHNKELLDNIIGRKKTND